MPFFTVDLPRDLHTEETSMGDWSKGPPVEDPLIYLLVHSDCEGVIHAEEGRHLAARMEQLVPALTVEGAPDFAARMEQAIPNLTVERMTDEWLRWATNRFIKGLRVAAEASEDVEFF